MLSLCVSSLPLTIEWRFIIEINNPELSQHSFIMSIKTEPNVSFMVSLSQLHNLLTEAVVMKSKNTSGSVPISVTFISDSYSIPK